MENTQKLMNNRNADFIHNKRITATATSRSSTKQVLLGPKPSLYSDPAKCHEFYCDLC